MWHCGRCRNTIPNAPRHEVGHGRKPSENRPSRQRDRFRAPESDLCFRRSLRCSSYYNYQILQAWNKISTSNMWGFASKAIASTSGPNNNSPRPNQPSSDSSDDEISTNNSQEEGLECPICCESFNIVENVPYVLLCGHTLCKNCVLGLQSSVIKFPTFPIHLPFFISCPWCNNLSFRILYKGTLKFPRKNYFLLWMVESLNGERLKSHSSCLDHHHPVWTRDSRSVGPRVHGSNHREPERLQSSLHKSLILFLNLTAKFPLIFLFLLIVLYAIPASIAILILYILITILFAVPSFLVLYFSYPGLDWLVTEIVN
ncbi:hypothetical protein L2E82_26829 [Cichorium intybus]|uniref:Uncharacterized protein n=1 Tax=Cichorium intybus TaxID=13427 RepID=A0ACB9CRY5_CICIN|nr:hypothetical protein L2E82_26829 [Cichorium intybus]